MLYEIFHIHFQPEVNAKPLYWAHAAEAPVEPVLPGADALIWVPDRQTDTGTHMLTATDLF